MTLTAPKIIAGLISILWGFAALLGPQNAQSEPSSSTIDLAPYLIEPTTTISSTTTSSTIVWINPESDACEQFSGAAVNMGWPIKQREMLKKVMFRESRCIPIAHNKADTVGQSYGLLQINTFWCQSKNSFLQTRGVLTDCESLLDPTINLQGWIVNLAEFPLASVGW
jgi:hypothetical protein